ncbi:MAG: hypothetical protein ACREGH_02055 [Minisyncoccia bacterium]
MDRRLLSLRINGMFLLGVLVVQYALGMYVNLFVSFPQNATGGQLWEFDWSQPPLASHTMLAFLIFLGAIVFCVRAMLYKQKKWIVGSVIGLLGVLAAGGSGATFVPTQTDLYSFSMSLCFLVAFASYCWVLFGTGKKYVIALPVMRPITSARSPKPHSSNSKTRTRNIFSRRTALRTAPAALAHRRARSSMLRLPSVSKELKAARTASAHGSLSS